MPDAITDAQLTWTQKFTGVNIEPAKDAAPGGFFDSIGDALSGAAHAVASAAEAVGETVVDGAKAVVHGVEVAGEAIEDGAIAVGRAVGLIDPPKPPDKIIPPVLAPEQQKRADAAQAKLSPEDQKKYQTMLDGAKSDKERQYLKKGLAAGHSLSELQAFETAISGKDEKWMQDNLSLTGNSDGKGIKQQWSMSCNATTAEAVRGQMDPLYALKLHQDNTDITKADGDNPDNLNKNMADEQKAMLQSANPDGSSGGVARPRNDATKVPGRWNTDLLNKDSASTGMSFENKRIGDGDLTVDKAVDDIASDVEKGMPVPIVIGNGTSAKFAHYVLVTAVDKGPPKAFSIHDPANGTTEVRTEDELKNGKIDLAGPSKGTGWMKLSAYEKPTPVAVK